MTKKIIFLMVICISFINCEDDEKITLPDEETRQISIGMTNSTGVASCGDEPFPVDFLINTVSPSISETVESGQTEIFIMWVAEENMNVQIYNTATDELIAESNVMIRLSSRPETITGARSINYCPDQGIQFLNF